MASLSYRVAPGLVLRWLDDELAVYQSDRRQTHLLDRQGGVLLTLLAAWPAHLPACDAQAMARSLLNDSPSAVPEADELAEVLVQLAPMLAALVGLGLLVARPC